MSLAPLQTAFVAAAAAAGALLTAAAPPPPVMSQAPLELWTASNDPLANGAFAADGSMVASRHPLLAAI